MKAVLSALSVGLALMVMATSASAVPFSYRFDSTVIAGTTGLPASPGDSASITVTLDNGGTSDLSQVWTGADLESVTFNINNGAAVVSFFSPFDGGLSDDAGSFETDATGSLISAPLEWFDEDISTDFTANVPVTPVLLWYINGFNPVLADDDDLSLYLSDVAGMRNPDNWSRVTALPLPPTLPLLIVGLVGVVFLRRAGPGTARGFAEARGA